MSGTDDLVSVVVPLYNAREHVADTLDSILMQSHENIEVIVIDDGSTDGSGELCRRVSNTDKRVRYFRQANAGVCAARNKGIDLAKGRYIAFCDHDDEFMPTLVEESLNAINGTGASFVKFGRIHLLGSKIIQRTPFPDKGKIYISSSQLLNVYKQLVEQKLLVYVWDALWDLDFLRGNAIRFEEGLCGGEEDRRFNTTCLASFDNMLVYPKYLYVHHSWSTSTAANSSLSRVEESVRSAEYECEMMNRRYGIAFKDEWTYGMIMHVRSICGGVVAIPSKELGWRDKRDLLRASVRRLGVPGQVETKGLSKMSKTVLWALRRSSYGLLLNLAQLNQIRHSLGAWRITR